MGLVAMRIGWHNFISDEEIKKTMTIPGLMMRFFLAYTVALVAAAFAMTAFKIPGSSGINTLVLAAVVVWVCMTYGKKNGQYLTSKQNIGVVIGFILIDLFLQMLFGIAAISQSSAGVNLGALLLAFGFFSIIHAVTILLFVRVAGKLLEVTGALK